jgi:ADP-heptose:LPS heptosyltransferase
VFRGLHEKFPGHTLKCVTANIYLAGALTDIAEHNPYIDEIIVIEPYDGCSARTKEVWNQHYGNCPNIEAELLWQKADKAYCLNTACVDYEWEAMKSEQGITKPRYQIWCDAVGVTPSSYSPIYQVTKVEQAIAKGVFDKRGFTGKPIVGVGCAACDPKRGIPLDKTAEICNGLKKAGVIPVTIDATLQIPGVESIIGTRLRDLMPMIKLMDAMITVDSGLLHMAGAVGTPVIGIFGPTDHKMRMGTYLGTATDSRKLMPCAPCWYGYHCLRDVDPSKHFECLKKIKSDIIVEETLRWLNRAGKLDS